MSRTYGVDIGFGQWMALGVPVMLLALPLVYVVLTRVVFRLGRESLPGVADLIVAERARMGRLSGAEAIVAAVFGLTALGWVFRPVLVNIIPGLSDTGIAIAGAVVLFLIPAPGEKGRMIMSWDAAKSVPWDVLLLFGGGLSLASRIQYSGLSVWLGDQAVRMEGLPLVVAVLCFGLLMLTELTSNTATAATFLPVVAAVAVSLGQNPLVLLAPTALAANCSYMMPVGTPPNAIVFGSGQITLPQMARAGMWFNVLLVPIIGRWCGCWGRGCWGLRSTCCRNGPDRE
ncbi:MAG: SLC13 family permease [Candidatus Synoicihabitans palmerolidicus]|nr:SLC13 family permease [Candidatus Synoicihabitans palmerolidicus]